MILKVGTRGSKLALIQTDIVLKMLSKTQPDLQFQKVIITTTGDKIRKPFTAYSSKGIFEREIDRELARGKVDFAVHSLKDVPVAPSDELVIAAIPKRDSPNDVLVSCNDKKLLELRSGSVIGTSSPRRMIQIKHVRPDLKVKQLRGNVERRIGKVSNGECDAIVLAEAGLERLQMNSVISERLHLETFTPAPGQGALAVVAREVDESTVRLLSGISNLPSKNEVTLERHVASKLGGGCQAPIGVISRQRSHTISVYACVFSFDGRKKLATKTVGHVNDRISVQNEAVDNLIKMGADSIVGEWREKSVKW